ncbi:TPA: DNA methylase, partial [Escherichia coli]|nr:DNA methylase [Escherichia coli]
MSRFVLGNCIDVMARIPDNAIDFILTDPPYLVGFRDRSGRTIAGDKTDEWLQPACNEMYRVLKKDALMVSFYGWNRVDRFMAAWKMRDSALLVTWSSPKTTHRRPHMWAIAT